MTPQALRERLLDHCDLPDGLRVLDPGVGTGEFLCSVAARAPRAELHGWDVDPAILEVARSLAPTGTQLSCRSALDPWSGPPFDLVIGNPPYFQFRAEPALRRAYARVISGRPNIFAMFFQVGIERLRPGGQLAFVVPPSMNNGAYFNNLRNYILESCAVEYLEVFASNDLFQGAQTSAQLLVLRKGDEDAGRHTLTRSTPAAGFQRTVFAEDAKTLASEFDGRKTLYELGYEAVTGSIVWNQHRASLRSTNGDKAVPLVWPHCIHSELRVDVGHRRPAFIETAVPPLLGPAVVVNRTTGSVGKGALRCALVPSGMRFLAENHVNVIRPHSHFPVRAGWDELLTRLRAPGITRRIRMLTGSTQISAKETTHLLPL